MALSGAERETVINMDDDSDYVTIWTAQRKVLSQLSRSPAFVQVGAGEHEGSPWAAFQIPASEFRFGAKRKVSDAQRAAAKARMADLRSKTPVASHDSQTEPGSEG